MSTSVLSAGFGQAATIYQVPIVKKLVMAATGLILFGYVLAHLFGNLQIYIGREQINRYAELLHSLPGPLWVARIVLLATVALHAVTSFQLWLLKRKARPIAYVKEERVPPGYASRTMLWTGPCIAAFVFYHVLHLTTGSLGLPFRELDAYDNIVNGFRVPLVSISYIAFMLVLCLHLYHGLWSMFQSVGASHPRYTPLIKRFAAGFAILIAAGNISIPVAVLTGFIRN